MVAIPALTFELLVLSWITAKRQLIYDRTASRTEWNNSYDYIIVGAGTAGCVVANRLAAGGQVSVLLLEAGGAQNALYHDIPTQFSAITPERPDLQWNYYNEPQMNAGLGFPGGRIPEQKGKTIGGSASHNAMMFNRGNARGYDEWAHKYGAKGWSFKEVLPFFKKYENNTDPRFLTMSPGYHGTTGPIQISTPKDPGQSLLILKSAYNSLGFRDTDINGAQQLGTMIDQSFIGLNGLRSNAANYVDPNPYPQSLHIVTKALVTKILFNGLTAVGVEFAKNDKPFRVYAKKEIILSAGPINSPQILMLSGVGPRQHLSSFNISVIIDLPVGDNYANHPWLNSYFPSSPPLSEHNLGQLYYNQSGQLSQFPILVNYFSTKYNREPEWPNAMIYSLPNPLNTTQIETFIDMMRGRSKGTIRLQSASPYAYPLISPEFLSDPQDFEEAVEAMKFYYYVMDLPQISPIADIPTFESVGCRSCPGIKNYLCDTGLRCFIRHSTQSSWHCGGSCRMGAVDRSDVVVDPKLRVKYAKRLRVCDSSIFPDLPNANTNAASLMVGEKCAQIVKDSYNL